MWLLLVPHITAYIQYLFYCDWLISVSIMSSWSIHIVTPSCLQKLLWKQDNESWPLASGPQALGLSSERPSLGDHSPFKGIGDGIVGISWTPQKKSVYHSLCLLPFSFQGPLKSKASYFSHWKASAGLAVRLGTVGSQDRLCSRLGTRPQCPMFGPSSRFEIAFPCLQRFLPHHTMSGFCSGCRKAGTFCADHADSHVGLLAELVSGCQSPGWLPCLLLGSLVMSDMTGSDF